MLILDLTDYLSDNGTLPIWTQIGSKQYLTAVISILKQIKFPECHAKILFLIKKWAEKYIVYQDLIPNFQELYVRLLQRNVVFAQNLITYQIYLNPIKYLNMIELNKARKEIEEERECEYEERDYNYSETLKLKLCLIKKDENNQRLINYISTVVESIYLANDILDHPSKGKEIFESTKDIFDFLNEAQKFFIEIISSDKVKEEELIKLIIGLNEDIYRTRNRVENKTQARPFLSVFIEQSLKEGLLLPKKSEKKQFF